MTRGLRWVLVSLPILALAAWPLSYRWCIAGSAPVLGHACFAAVAAGDATFYLSDFPVPPWFELQDARVEPNDGGWFEREYGPLANAIGFRWGTHAQRTWVRITARILVVPLWAVAVALAVPAWHWRPRRRERGAGVRGRDSAGRRGSGR